MHKDLNIFNTQGLEKLNGFCIQYYHSSTNKQIGSGDNKNKYLKQLISKRNRMEFSILNGNFADFFDEDSDEDEDYDPEFGTSSSSSDGEIEDVSSDEEIP